MLSQILTDLRNMILKSIKIRTAGISDFIWDKEVVRQQK